MVEHKARGTYYTCDGCGEDLGSSPPKQQPGGSLFGFASAMTHYCSYCYSRQGAAFAALRPVRQPPISEAEGLDEEPPGAPQGA